MADLFTVSKSGEVKAHLSCTDCELAKGCNLVTNNMQGTGPVGADFAVIGQWVGAEDDRLGKPHTGKNGRMFREFCEAAGLEVNRLFLSNALRCRPDDEGKDAHFKKCQKHLIKDLARIKPKAIISLGAKALFWLTGYTGVKQFRRCGIPCLLAPEIFVYPLQQPMAIIHAETPAEGDRLKTELIADLLWLRNKADEGSLDRPDDVICDYKLAETLDDVRDFLAEFEDVEDICADFETADKDLGPTFRTLPTSHISMIALSKGPGHARAIPYRARGRQSIWWWTDDEMATLRQMFAAFFGRQDKWFFFQNGKFDSKWSLHDFGVIPKRRYDTQFCHYLIDENLNRGLEDITIKYSKMAPWKPPSLVKLMKETVELAKYACKDVDATYRCKEGMPYDARMKWLMEELLIPLSNDYMQLEVNGIAIHKENLTLYGKYLVDLIREHELALKQMDVVKRFEVSGNIEFNPEAPHHVADIMENYLKLPRVDATEKGNRYSTGVATLERYLDNEFVSHLYLHRKLTKLKSSYYDVIVRNLEYEPLIHTNVRVDGTVTGRPTSKDPTLFTMPRADTVEKTGITDPKIAKAIFCTRDLLNRVLVQIDMSQIEIRVLACLSKDENLVRAYRDGIDLHRLTASKVCQIPIEKVSSGQRSQAKAVTFGLVYGQGEKGLGDEFVLAARKRAKKAQKSFTVDDEREARQLASDFISGHKREFPQVWSWMAEQERIIKRFGYQETVFGRRRHYDRVGPREIRQSLNTPVQGAAADLCSLSIIWANKSIREQGLDALHVLSVYDSIVMDTAKEHVWETAETVIFVMEDMLPSVFPDILIVPIKADVEIGTDLGHMIKVNVATRTAIKEE